MENCTKEMSEIREEKWKLENKRWHKWEFDKKEEMIKLSSDTLAYTKILADATDESTAAIDKQWREKTHPQVVPPNRKKMEWQKNCPLISSDF